MYFICDKRNNFFLFRSFQCIYVFLNEVLLQLHEEKSKFYWLLYCLDINKCAEKETKQQSINYKFTLYIVSFYSYNNRLLFDHVTIHQKR